VYDRAGRGWSDAADAPQDGAQIATDLHSLLHAADVPGPYVIAGHSFGGLYTLTFAARYPDEVAGMVLVDSTAPAPRPGPTTASPDDAGSDNVMGRASALASISARLGLARLYGLLAGDGLPPQSHDEVSARSATAGNLRSVIEEYVHAGASAEHAASLRDFGAKPLVVLTAGSGSAAGWAEKQNALATLSTNSAHRTIDGATHLDLAEDQDKATATSQAIHDVVSSVRSATPLQK
jgi:pimeloyl-ACP methyl ester carboxylesterase